MRFAEISSKINSLGRPISNVAAFAAWFGNSKVVDKLKRPLVVYHGTQSEFHSFDHTRANSQSGTGVPTHAMFFTGDPEVAGTYTAVDLSPVGFRTQAETDEFRELVLAGTFDQQMQYLHDHPQIPKPVYKEGGNIKACYLRIERPLRINAKGDNWDDIYVVLPKWSGKQDSYSTNDIARYAFENKYDGCIISNVNDAAKKPAPISTTYVVFSPMQIKSAISNNAFRKDTAHIGETTGDTR